MSQKRKTPASSTDLSDVDINHPDIFRSDPIEDRTSIFVAHFSPTLSIKDLVKSSTEFSSASHRIQAWRKLSAQRSITNDPNRRIFDAGHEDDGESYAGKKLEKVLEDVKVEGALVVARWYGGVMLGPVRFTHMETCARQAILRSRTAADDQAAKRLKTIDEAVDRHRLERILRERDQSIAVLRNLLAKKSASSDEKEPSANQSPSSSPAKPLNYDALPVPALARLEKARDATIAWILRKIDQAEVAAKTTPAGEKTEEPN